MVACTCIRVHVHVYTTNLALSSLRKLSCESSFVGNSSRARGLSNVKIYLTGVHINER